MNCKHEFALSYVLLLLWVGTLYASLAHLAEEMAAAASLEMSGTRFLQGRKSVEPVSICN